MKKETKKYDEDYLNGLIAKAKKSWEGVDVDSYMNNLRDDSFDKEVVEKLSKEVTSYITEQIKSNMNIVTIKCRDLMVGDWVTNEHRFPSQIINVGNACAYTIFGGNKGDEDNEGEPWVFDDYVYLPVPIPLTPEILEKNGWKETEYWHEYKDGNTIIQYSLSNIWGIINEIEIEHFKCEYVHQLQHLLRLCGLDELADNFKV